METNRIRRFATEARNKLKEGVAARIRTLGFDKKGNVAEEHRPQLMQGGTHWNGQLLPETFFHQWTSLYRRIQQKGIGEVYEEAAYTWFNRLCALRILQKNGLCAPVLDYADAARTPFIVDEARQGRFPGMDDETRSRLVDLLDDDTKVTEQFAALINAWCHDNPVIYRCFGAMADYTELLLPANILAEGGFVDMLNHTDFITDADYRSPELIGWLYQFYISERKDEVFARKGKFEADEIPAATQIFTPNWIVKYMVQNTLGRIYLDNTPRETQLQKKWQYLVEPSEKPSADSILKYEELTDLRVADLACGSGHILNECFDLLYDLYIAEGYSRREAIENIFRHNLTGVDIDTRAKQLATFALLLKACQKDGSFADARCMPRVMDMPRCDCHTWRDTAGHFNCHYGMAANEAVDGELDDAFALMENADTLGSIMRFNVSPQAADYLRQAVKAYDDSPACIEQFAPLADGMRVILALTEKYSALVMNPPYMGGGNMNDVLGSYVKDNYAESKADLFSVFMEVCISRLRQHGKYGMINMQSWMFLFSFERLRKQVLENYSIESMLHLGPRTFDELSGEVVQNTAFVICNGRPDDTEGIYYRLIDGKNCDEKNRLFLSHLCGNEDGQKIYYPHVKQKDFEKIPGCPIGYWVSEKMIEAFVEYLPLSSLATTRIGLVTGDNPHYLRFWREVSMKKLSFTANNSIRWYPLSKGGTFRKWFGNNEVVLDWLNDGEELLNRKADSGKRLLAHNFNGEFALREGITLPAICSGNFSARYQPTGFFFDSASTNTFPKEEKNIYTLLALLNSKITKEVLDVVNPTLNILPGYIDCIPYCSELNHNDETETLVSQNISISKQDWDAHETSWDFETNPLLAIDNKPGSLKERVGQYKQEWERKFRQLHANEEELNRQFIDIYGLQDELTPDVPLEEVTILQQGEISISDGQIVWHDDVIVKQLISYAVGCMMGRYRLDKKGLHIAHPNPTAEEAAPYIYNKVEFEIDEDGIIPLMPNDCGFSDNASNRFSDFVRIALGVAEHVENLNFVEKCLGKSVEQYFVKDFWKDHKKMYQNRPIYWLFASKKGAFQCIAYMHRMNAYTADRIRAKYLLPYIETLQSRIADLDARRSELATRETRQLQQLARVLEECREYHDRLQVVAEQAIAFDLDDGVVANYAKFGDVLQKIK